MKENDEKVAEVFAALGEKTDVEEYITADDELCAVESNSQDVNRAEEDKEDTETEEDVLIQEEEEQVIPKPSMVEVREAMNTLTRFFYHDNFISQIDFDRLRRAFRKKQLESMQQAKITDYSQAK
jgi:hypothetical protein